MTTCTCGDDIQEHKPRKTGAGECEVPGCPCVQFDWDGDEDVDVDD